MSIMSVISDQQINLEKPFSNQNIFRLFRYLLVKLTFFISGLRLLGIGRNQYIDMMNQCKSSKVI